ncbi:hypothetical protein B0H12DRAFT_1135964 [Mycena haematopus]|nr:hypothetical protein B0H12DRAFT_1135964 [Mycena haematopus]
MSCVRRALQFLCCRIDQRATFRAPGSHPRDFSSAFVDRWGVWQCRSDPSDFGARRSSQSEKKLFEATESLQSKT